MKNLTLFLLRPLAILYGSIQSIRRYLYEKGMIPSHRLPGIVISIGNIESGGTGKSPVVIALAKKLVEDGFQPAIVTRGYKSGLKPEESAILLAGSVTYSDTNRSFFADEARMQSHTLPSVPVIIGSKRFASTQKYLERFSPPTHWILEDGFQHLQLARDHDVVLLDYHQPFGNGWPLPSGLLREFPATIRKADSILLTRAPDAKAPSPLGENHEVFLSEFHNDQIELREGQDLTDFSLKKWLLVTGIAKPNQLKLALQRLNLNLVESYIVADHAPFQPEILASLAQDCDGIITTEKDYYRDVNLFSNLAQPTYTLSLNADIDSLYNSKHFQPLRNIRS